MHWSTCKVSPLTRRSSESLLGAHSESPVHVGAGTFTLFCECRSLPAVYHAQQLPSVYSNVFSPPRHLGVQQSFELPCSPTSSTHSDMNFSYTIFTSPISLFRDLVVVHLCTYRKSIGLPSQSGISTLFMNWIHSRHRVS